MEIWKNFKVKKEVFESLTVSPRDGVITVRKYWISLREDWRDVIGFEGLYQISCFGRLRGLDRIVPARWGTAKIPGRVLRLSNRKDGYLRAWLCINSEVFAYLSHRLVAVAFVPNPDNLPEVNHLDNDRANSMYLNLEWSTHAGNMRYAANQGRLLGPKGETSPNAKLTEKAVLEIRNTKMARTGQLSRGGFAKKYNVTKTTIRAVLTRKSWKHI